MFFLSFDNNPVRIAAFLFPYHPAKALPLIIWYNITVIIMSAARSRVLSAYRRLFRARKQLFQGDTQAMQQSRIAIKSEFIKNKDVAPTSGDHFEGLLSMVDEAEDMLLHGIVQGRLNQTSGHYGTFDSSGWL